MGTTASPWRYDTAAAQAIRPDNVRRTAILHYASRVSRSQVVGYPSIPVLSINPGNGTMCQEPTSGGVPANSRVLHRASCTTVLSHSCVVSQQMRLLTRPRIVEIVSRSVRAGSL